MRCASRPEMVRIARGLHGHLTATIHGTEKDLSDFAELVAVLRRKVGRLVFNGFPTGVEVCHAMHHGGPYPATTDSRETSVGTAAIHRFVAPGLLPGLPAVGAARGAQRRESARACGGWSTARRRKSPCEALAPESIEVVDSHTEGEPTRVVVGGLARACGADDGRPPRGARDASTTTSGARSCSSRAATTRWSARC